MSDRKTLLLTASGILVAILLVWAQLWTNTAQIYQAGGFHLITVGYGLLFVYFAMVASVFAFILILFSRNDLRPAFGLLLSALFITVIEVVGTTVTVWDKTWNTPDLLLTPSHTALQTISSHAGSANWVVMVGIPGILLIASYLLVYGVRRIEGLVNGHDDS